LKHEEDKLIFHLINLKHIENCKILKTDILDDDQNGQKYTSYRLDLSLKLADNSRSEMKLEFYINPAFMPANEDHAHIQKWSGIIMNHI